MSNLEWLDRLERWLSEVEDGYLLTLADVRDDFRRLIASVRELHAALDGLVKAPVCGCGGHLSHEWLLAMGKAALVLEKWSGEDS